ncbi:MAG: hypothetical protein ABI130_11875 [Leifsonia sp.]
MSTTTAYSWKVLKHDVDRVGELTLIWEAHGDPVSDYYGSDGVAAPDL